MVLLIFLSFGVKIRKYFCDVLVRVKCTQSFNSIYFSMWGYDNVPIEYEIFGFSHNILRVTDITQQPKKHRKIKRQVEKNKKFSPLASFLEIIG